MLDLLYAQAAAVRRRWYERHPEARRRLQRPVISVGNLSVGGTGKTPLVAAIAQWLIDRGERPAILSRGYGRTLRDVGASAISDGERVVGGLDDAGDEPLMLARALPGAVVVVAEDRYLAGALAERKLGATVHLLDDGFQHLALARDLDVLVTRTGEIGGGRVLPFGRLRERAYAAARADLVVVIGADAAAARAEAWNLGVSQSCSAQRVVELAERGPSLAFAGIGDPNQFFDGLRAAGADLRAVKSFPDHHRYSRADVGAIARALEDCGAEQVVTTAKDAVRLEALGALPFEVRVASLALRFDPPDTLFAGVEAAIERSRTAA